MAQYLVRATPNTTSIKSGGAVTVKIDYYIDPPAPTPSPKLKFSSSPLFKVTANPSSPSLSGTGNASVTMAFTVAQLKGTKVHTCTLLFNALDDECTCSFEVT
jgi:hypothetical protein